MKNGETAVTSSDNQAVGSKSKQMEAFFAIEVLNCESH